MTGVDRDVGDGSVEVRRCFGRSLGFSGGGDHWWWWTFGVKLLQIFEQMGRILIGVSIGRSRLWERLSRHCVVGRRSGSWSEGFGLILHVHACTLCTIWNGWSLIREDELQLEDFSCFPIGRLEVGGVWFWLEAITGCFGVSLECWVVCFFR